MYVLLTTYNNYYNRMLKVEQTLADYIQAVGGQYILLQNNNFNPADGVTTVVTLGTGKGQFLN